MLQWIDIVKRINNGNITPARRVKKTDAEWQQLLTDEEYRVTRLSGTEQAHSSDMCSRFEPGIYACTCCGELLFDANEKFESGTGWPSFTNPIDERAIAYVKDTKYGMVRVETICNVCDAHLGHVFPDGPEPSGLRYCMNAVALKKVETNTATAVFGGGCFWCTEASFSELKGIDKVVSGYSGGEVKNPTYKEVCSGMTGHAEVVQVTYQPNIISFEELMTIHLTTHNPTTLNKQGGDVGTQYRSVIFYRTNEEKEIAQQVIEKIQAYYDEPIVTEITQFKVFYAAEDYHQNYYAQHPEEGYCSAVIAPKLKKFRQFYAEKLK